VLVVFYAFVGFENAVVPAGETKDPRSTLPRAILLTIAVTAGLYLLVQLAFVTAFPNGGADGDAPLIDLGLKLAGPIGAALLTLAAVSSLAGNLHGIMASTPRVTHAMALRGDLPGWFGRVSARFETPANSIGFLGLLAAVLAVSGSFVWLAAVSTLARLIVYAVTIAALPRAPERKRITVGQWASGAAGVVVCIFAAAQAKAEAWTTLAALSAAGLLLYVLASRGSASFSSSASSSGR
jgi:amino acid transporter